METDTRFIDDWNMPQPKQKCPHCKGSGRYDFNRPCKVCKATGICLDKPIFGLTKGLNITV